MWQLETGHNGTPHLQGYVIWSTNYNLAWVKQQCPRAHWEIARGDFKSNFKYCTKDEGRISGPWERGTKPTPGKRNDILDATEMLDEGEPMALVARAFPSTFVKYHNGLMRYRQETYPVRDGEPNIIILWGPSGCGKSRLVQDTFPGAYRKPKGKWWDGYHTHDTVIFDDFYSWISYDEILRVLDWYPLLVQVKNGFVPLRATTFVFTSNQDPGTWYTTHNPTRQQLDRSALFRRFKQFGLVLKWGLVGRRNNSGTVTYSSDWVIDTQFKQ